MKENRKEQNSDSCPKLPDGEDISAGISEPSSGQKSGEQIAESAPSPRRRLGYYKILLFIVAALIIAIGAGTAVFWRYIEAYETSRHKHVIEYLRENIDYDFWERNVETMLISQLTEFESGNTAPIEPHISKIRDVQYTFRQKSDESTQDSPVYIIRAGPRDIGIVRLAVIGQAGFGFNMWEVGSIELLDSFVDDLAGSVSITASQNARVELNGITVSQDFRTDCEFEHGATYVIQGIFGEVEVSVFEFDESLSSPYFAENGEYYFPIINPFARSFNVLVPEGAGVFVDGEKVSPEYISERRIIPEIFIGAIDNSNVPLRLLRYEFEQDGFYLEPVVTALDYQGIELLPTVSDDGEIHFVTPFSPQLKEEHSATVEAFIRAFVNFSANAGENFSGNHANVNNRMLRSSELYTRTQGASGMMSRIRGASVRYNSIETENFRSYGDGHFSCEVRYSITNRTPYQTRDVDGHFELLFVLSGGRWLAAKMTVIA